MFAGEGAWHVCPIYPTETADNMENKLNFQQR